MDVKTTYLNRDLDYMNQLISFKVKENKHEVYDLERPTFIPQTIG